MRKNAPTDVSVSKRFPGVIPPDPRYRKGATPFRTLPNTAYGRVSGRKRPGCWDLRASRTPLEYGLATGLCASDFCTQLFSLTYGLPSTDKWLSLHDQHVSQPNALFHLELVCIVQRSSPILSVELCHFSFYPSAICFPLADISTSPHDLHITFSYSVHVSKPYH